MRLSDIVRATHAEAERTRRRTTLERQDPRGQRVLLVYLFDGLGDVVLLAPLVRALLQRGAEVEVLVRPLGDRVLARAGLPAARHVLARDASAAARRRLLRALDARAFDTAVDLTFRGDLDARPYLRAQRRIGWLAPDEDVAEAGLDAGLEDLRPQADRHWSRAGCALLAALDVDHPAFDVPWRAPASAGRWAKARWSRRPRVLLVPGSRSADKRWLGWRDVAGGLIESHRAGVVITGAPWERAALQPLARELGARLFTGRDLARLLALVQHADLVLTNDTGPMHWAFACGTPTVALFQHMAPECWGPHEARAHLVVRRVTPGAEDPATTAWVLAQARVRLDAARAPGPRTRPRA